jgi:hypothetical protein
MANTSAPDKPHNFGSYLIGFSPLRPGMEKVRDDWSRAVQYIKTLTASEPNIADNPHMEPLPDEIFELKARLMSEQSFKDAFPRVGVDVNMVNLDQLVVSQEYISPTYVEQLTERLNQVTDPPSLFDFCMHTTTGRVDIVRDRDFQPVGVLTESHEHRLIDVRCLSPDEVRLTNPNATPLKDYTTAHFLVSFGFTANHLSVYLVENRLIIRNGSHRALSLLKAGHKEVPCVVQYANRGRLLQDGIPLAQLQVCLETPRPPMLKDYLNQQLIVAGPAPELRKKCMYVKIETQYIGAGVAES